MMHRFSKEALAELRQLRDEAERLGTNWETFAAAHLGMRLDQFRIYLSTGLKPDVEAA